MITEKQREMWESYKYNHSYALLEDVLQLQKNVRYRKIDHIDCLELICAIERHDAFVEFCKTADIIFLSDVYKPTKKH